MDAAPTHFARFKELPKAIRIRVWTFAASQPRVVELHEHYSTVFHDGKTEYQTAVGSRTRPPAMLFACAEAERVALSIFIPMYKHVHTRSNCSPGVPILVNPHTDITYRGMDSEPFRLLGPDFTKDVVPLGTTQTLAINSKILAKLNMNGLQTKPCSVPAKPKEEENVSFPEQIMACTRFGLKVLIFVVGNDEDHAEFEMEDVDPLCVRARKALSQVALLRIKLSPYTQWPIQPPEIKVMKVKSRAAPIPPFHQFSRLPQELQNIVWDYASNERRFISVKHTPYPFRNNKIPPDENVISHRCQPPLLSVCRASRTIAMKKLTRIPWTTGSRPGYYNKSLDVVIAPQFDRYASAFADWEIKYLGLHLSGLDASTDVYFVRQIKGVRKVFLTVGECHPNSEIILMPITKSYDMTQNGVIRFNKQYCFVQDKAQELRNEFHKAATRHNDLQKKQEEAGKPREGPNWNPPAVKASKMVAVSRVVSPYSYRGPSRY